MTNYQRQRETTVQQLVELNQQLAGIAQRVRAAGTVQAKQEIFVERDRLLEQITQLQTEQALRDRDEMAEISQKLEQPRFQPAARTQR